MRAYHIVVVDDEAANLESLERILKSDGAKVSCFKGAQEALEFIRKGAVDLVMTDLRMRSMDGMELLTALKHIDSGIDVVMITAYGTVELAVEAMKNGAYDFITKPLQRIQVLRVVHRALEKRCLVSENLSLREELNSNLETKEGQILGKSEAVMQMMEIAEQAAHSRANVLIEGESGTGKGILAEYLHRESNFSEGIFVKINCAAIPENLLEAELFGYEPGAFTGATKRKKGRVELADGGTLFLDEIGIAPLPLQSKLLRFIQDGEFERLGSNETLVVRTRVISATNSKLKETIAKGEFREDLYYRLNVIHLKVPPLRERLGDIPLLVQRFLEESAKKNGRKVPLVHSEAMECLARHAWPGNIRELQNLMERLVVLNRSGVIEPSNLPREYGGHPQQKTVVVPIGLSLKKIERMVLDETLRSTKGNKRLAARLLGVHPRTIYRHLEQGEPIPVPPSTNDKQTKEKGSV